MNNKIVLTQGVLTSTPSGEHIYCHECMLPVRHLSAHAFNTHGFKKNGYNKRYGFPKDIVLVSPGYKLELENKTALFRKTKKINPRVEKLLKQYKVKSI